jgi:hypothetical protein
MKMKQCSRASSMAFSAMVMGVTTPKFNMMCDEMPKVMDGGWSTGHGAPRQ